jgi:hypothetical protein
MPAALKMDDGDRITFWTVYHNPADYPGKYVVRAQWAERGGQIKHSAECTVHDTLEGARAAVPPGCWPFARDPNDDPVIVESWMQ